MELLMYSQISYKQKIKQTSSGQGGISITSIRPPFFLPVHTHPHSLWLTFACCWFLVASRHVAVVFAFFTYFVWTRRRRFGFYCLACCFENTKNETQKKPNRCFVAECPFFFVGFGPPKMAKSPRKCLHSRRFGGNWNARVFYAPIYWFWISL